MTEETKSKGEIWSAVATIFKWGAILTIVILLLHNLSNFKRIAGYGMDIETRDVHDLKNGLNEQAKVDNMLVKFLDNLGQNLPEGTGKLVKDSIAIYRCQIILKSNMTTELLDSLNIYGKLNPSQKEHLLTKIRSFLVSDDTKQRIIDWGIVKEHAFFENMIDSLSKRKDANKDMLYQLIAFKKETQVLKNKLEQEKLDNKNLTAQNESLKHSLDSINASFSNVRGKYNNAKTSLDSAEMIIHNADRVRLITFEFLPIKAKRRNDRTYKLSQLNTGVQLNYKLASNGIKLDKDEQIEIVMTFPVKGNDLPRRYSVSRKIEFDKNETEPLPTSKFATGQYICEIFCKNKKVYYSCIKFLTQQK